MSYWDGTRWIANAPTTIEPRPYRRFFGAFAEATLVTALIFGLVAGTTLAARPSSATLSVTPNDAPAWASANAHGCGYGAAEVYLDIVKPEAHAFMAALPDADGCISVTFTTDGPGIYHLETRQRQGNGKKWSLLATYDLPVI